MKNRIIISVVAFFMFVDVLVVVLAINVTPLTLKREYFVYEYGKDEISTNVADYINANKNVIKEAMLNFTDVKNLIGTYQAKITYLGKEYPFYIKIVDTIKPVVKLKEVQVNISIGATINAIDLIEAQDSSDIIAYFNSEDEQKLSSKIFNEIGSFVENIIVEDSSGNQSAMLRVKIVVYPNGKGNIPAINGINNIEIEKNSHFDPMQGVKATDGKGNDITSKIIILKNDVNTSISGTYEVIYSITNEEGNTKQQSRKVIVLNQENN